MMSQPALPRVEQPISANVESSGGRKRLRPPSHGAFGVRQTELAPIPVSHETTIREPHAVSHEHKEVKQEVRDGEIDQVTGRIHVVIPPTPVKPPQVRIEEIREEHNQKENNELQDNIEPEVSPAVELPPIREDPEDES